MPKCPFTGLPIKVFETTSGEQSAVRYFGVMNSPLGGYTTGLFQEKEKLLAFLNGRDGNIEPVQRVTLVEPKAEAPDTTLEDEGKALHEESQEVAAKIVVDTVCAARRGRRLKPM